MVLMVFYKIPDNHGLVATTSARNIRTGFGTGVSFGHNSLSGTLDNGESLKIENLLKVHMSSEATNELVPSSPRFEQEYM